MASYHSYVLSLLLAVSLPVSLCRSSEREVTVEVPAGKEECFYESLAAGDTLDVDYQVVDGGRHNEIEINFRLSKPDGIPLVADFRRSDNSHRQTVKAEGDYKLCFDNSISRFSSKIVFFEIIVESGSADDDADEDEFYDIFGKDAALREGSDSYDVAVQDITDALKTIRDKVSRSRRFQDQIRSFESRDRSMAEHNFERVNFWSTVQVAGMLLAGVVQVILVRSLFDEKSSLHALWKRMC